MEGLGLERAVEVLAFMDQVDAMVSVGIGKVLVNLGFDPFQALGKLLQFLGKLVLLLGEMINLQFESVYPVRKVVLFHFKPIHFL